MKNKFFTNFLMRIAGGGISDSLRKHSLSSETLATTYERRSETDQQPISNRCQIGGEQTIATIATTATVATRYFARIAAMLLMLVTMSVGQVLG